MQSTMPFPRNALPPQMRRRVERSPVDFAALFFLLLVLASVAGFITWQFWHTSRIYGGVQVAGVNIGGMTRAQSLQELAQHLDAYSAPAVSLQLGEQQWPISADQLAAQSDLLGAVNQAYLVGREGNWVERATVQVAAMLGRANIEPVVTFNRDALQQALEPIANQVRQPSRPARQIGEVNLPAEAGIEVDIESTVNTLLRTLQEQTAATLVRMPLQVTEIAPAPLAAPTATSELVEQAPLLTPLQLYDNRYGIQLALDPVVLQRIVVQRDPISINEDALRQQLTAWAQQLNIAPQDARLNFNPSTGGITVLKQSQVGRQVDIEATLASVRDTLTAGGTQANLLIADVPPAVDMNRIAEMGIRELVASGTTYFKGSSAARVHNIEVASEQFEGLVIAPGGIFSFNEGVEDVSSANGFEDSLIIWGDQTATGVGGGVCQVSTTVFRAAYNAGLPIVERYNHGYVVDWYGEPGLDATIFTPSVDFRFRNDTGAHLLIDPVVDSVNGTMTFNFYGTKPNRQVTVGAPVFTDVKEAPAAEYRVDESLAPGQQKQVEWQQRGMTVNVTRTIVENGTTRTDTISSKYQPWRAVYLVAPGAAILDGPAESTLEAPPATETTVSPIDETTGAVLPDAPAEGP